MSNWSLEFGFRIVAAVLVGIAALFFLWKNYDGAFISAAVGCVAFFLSYRYQVKERVDQRNEEIIAENELDHSSAQQQEVSGSEPEPARVESEK